MAPRGIGGRGSEEPVGGRVNDLAPGNASASARRRSRPVGGVDEVVEVDVVVVGLGGRQARAAPWRRGLGRRRRPTSATGTGRPKWAAERRLRRSRPQSSQRCDVDRVGQAEHGRAVGRPTTNAAGEPGLGRCGEFGRQAPSHAAVSVGEIAPAGRGVASGGVGARRAGPRRRPGPCRPSGRGVERRLGAGVVGVTRAGRGGAGGAAGAPVADGVPRRRGGRCAAGGSGAWPGGRGLVRASWSRCAVGRTGRPARGSARASAGAGASSAGRRRVGGRVPVRRRRTVGAASRWRAVAVWSRVAARPAPHARAEACSSRLTRSARAAEAVSTSGRVRRTSATSSGIRGSGRLAHLDEASPTSSRARVTRPRSSRWAWSRARSWSASERGRRSACMAARKTSRRRARSASPTPRAAAPGGGRLDGDQGAARVVVAEGVDQLVERVEVVGHPAGGDHLVEGRERVAGRAGAGAHARSSSVVARRRARRRSTTHSTCCGEVVGRQQVELEVLGAAADGGQHLLGVGGGQHEHHVLGRLLERLEQGVGRRRSRACGPRRGCTPWCARACRATPRR